MHEPWDNHGDEIGIIPPPLSSRELPKIDPHTYTHTYPKPFPGDRIGINMCLKCVQLLLNKLNVVL